MNVTVAHQVECRRIYFAVIEPFNLIIAADGAAIVGCAMWPVEQASAVNYY